MAVITLGCVGISQGTDLPVVGTHVGFQVLFMARTALVGHRKFERIVARTGDGVGGVTVGAHRRFHILFLHHGLAVHRTRVRLQLVFVALGAAGLRNAQSHR